MSTSPAILFFEGLSSTIVDILTEELKIARSPVFAGFSQIEVFRHSAGLVFRLESGKAGYSFCRDTGLGDITTFRDFIHDPVQSLYMPIAYDVKEPSSEVVRGILEKYETFGAHHAAKIDWIWYESRGRHLLIMRIPKEIIRAMILLEGGTLSTSVRGPVGAIRNLPVLGKIVPAEANDNEHMHRAFVTSYTGPDQYEQSLAVHHAALREVIGAGSLGISIGPIAVWTP